MERPNERGALEGSAEGAGVLGGPDEMGRRLARWVADALVDEAASERARQHWLRVQAAEEATVAGVLVDLAERGGSVVLDVRGHRHRVRIVAVGADFVAGRSEHGSQLLVRTSAVEVIGTGPGGASVIGDRAAALDVSLAGVLPAVAADRPDVLLRTRSGAIVRGQLRGGSRELLQLRMPGDPPSRAWVPVDAIDLVIVDD